MRKVSEKKYHVSREKVLANIARIQQGDVVELHWADASKNLGVKKIDNRVVSCYKKFVGRFIMRWNEKLYGLEYLVLESIEPEFGDVPIWCILTASVVYVHWVGKKPKKVTSAVGQVYLNGGKLKIVEREGGVGNRA